MIQYAAPLRLYSVVANSILILRSRARFARRLEGWAADGLSWFETREDALLTMRIAYPFPWARMKSKSQPSSACRMVSLNRCA
jgi:hypothetical protein